MNQLDERPVSGFWCYTHRDNDHSTGRIVELANQISNEYGLLTGQALDIFVDRKTLKWGDVFRERISQSLSEALFFIPIITPSFFKSEECRRELLQFHEYAVGKNAEALLLPILFVPVDDMGENSPDELMRMIATTQYENWTDLRFDDPQSANYSRAVNKLAARIKSIADDHVASQPGDLDPPSAISESLEDEVEGLIDLIAQGEQAVPMWVSTLEQFTEVAKRIGEKTDSHAPSIRDASSGAGKLTQIHRYVTDVGSSADELLLLGQTYLEYVGLTSQSVLAVLAELANAKSDEDIQAAINFLETLVDTVAITQKMAGASIDASAQVATLNKASKLFRPVVTKLRNAFQSIVDGQAIIDQWESGVLDTLEQLPRD